MAWGLPTNCGHSPSATAKAGTHRQEALHGLLQGLLQGNLAGVQVGIPPVLARPPLIVLSQSCRHRALVESQASRQHKIGLAVCDHMLPVDHHVKHNFGSCVNQTAGVLLPQAAGGGPPCCCRGPLLRQRATGGCGCRHVRLPRELEHKLLQSLVRGAGAGMVAVPGEDGREQAALHQAAETIAAAG